MLSLLLNFPFFFYITVLIGNRQISQISVLKMSTKISYQAPIALTLLICFIHICFIIFFSGLYIFTLKKSQITMSCNCSCLGMTGSPVTPRSRLLQRKGGWLLLRDGLGPQSMGLTQEGPSSLTDCLLLCSQQWEFRCEAGTQRGGHIPASDFLSREF